MIQKLFSKIKSALISNANIDLYEKHKAKVEELMSHRESFNAFVYTPMEEAIQLLKERWHDKQIKIPIPIPEIFEAGFKAVLARQIVTPNYEVIRFLSIADGFEMEPVIFEYKDDKFVTENEWKYHLGKLHFYFGFGRNGGVKLKHAKIINFNECNGKKLSDIKTVWGQALIDFHHEMFLSRFPKLEGSLYDASHWYKMNGGCAKEYYKMFFYLFIKHGILFENFLLDAEEEEFSRHIFLPALIETRERTGVKPLIVALEPTDIEGDVFWMCHPPERELELSSKLKATAL